MSASAPEWTAQVDALTNAQRLRFPALTFRALFDLLETDPSFADWYTATLARSPFDAFFWEHPPFTTSSFDDPAELVLLAGPSLARLRADSTPFRDRLDSDAEVVTFENLGGDAVLIVPRPLGPPDAYPHLAAFLRLAPRPQVHALWRVTSYVVRTHLGTAPRWLSTAGMGVSWLHLRLDTRPKYYRHAPYRLA